MLRRACRLSMEFATAKKRHEIGRLLEAYRGAVNFYVRSLWPHPGALDKRTLARLPAERTRLQSMQKDQALRQALAMASSTRRSAKALGVPAQCPHFKGMAVLCHGVTLEPGRGSFDLVVRLSTLRPRERITIPTRQTRVLNTWLSRPGARLVQGCALSEKAIVVWVEFPEPQARESGDVIGIDVGISKLIATSEAQAIGTQWRQISARVRRRRPGSQGKRRACIARDHSINHAVKQLPWQRLSAIGFEDLNGLKRGKSRRRGKIFRIAAAPWTYRRVRQRVECLALENRVLPVAVDPRGTSRTCPACGKDDRRNRKGEVFRCIACDHKGDADFIGAQNVLTKTLAALGRVLSPGQKMLAHQ
jgi:Putative transposase DNA-binding domain